jgi:hypothetical protein
VVLSGGSLLWFLRRKEGLGVEFVAEGSRYGMSVPKALSSRRGASVRHCSGQIARIAGVAMWGMTKRKC